MRALFVTLLALVVVFQFSWTAAAGYDSHQPHPEQAWHFGHHGDEHADSAGASQAGKLLAAKSISDHGHCHHVPLAPVVLASDQAVEPVREHVPPYSQTLSTGEWRSTIERPKWQRA